MSIATQRELFDGDEGYSPALDRTRLLGQLRRVFTLMADRSWRSLAVIAAVTGAPQASVSARLRDLRKAKWGAYTVERRRIGGGLWEYRVLGASVPSTKDAASALASRGRVSRG